MDDGGLRLKPPAEMKNILATHGISPEKEIVPYCHRGARSAYLYWALKSLGYPRVRNFLGSWHEWSAREDLPLEKG